MMIDDWTNLYCATGKAFIKDNEKVLPCTVQNAGQHYRTDTVRGVVYDTVLVYILM